MLKNAADILICPECRQPPQAWPLDPDSLCCTNPGCGRVYPRLPGGIPVVLPGPLESILPSDLPEEFTNPERMLARLGRLKPGDPYWEKSVFFAMYLSAHYGGETEPFTALCDLFLPQIPIPITSAVDLGCGPGRLTLETAHRTGAAVVGLDLDPMSLYWAWAASNCQKLVWPRLRTELHFELHEAVVPVNASPGRVRWVYGDAVNPPLVAEAFDLVLAVNLLDSVRDPHVALGQAAALLRPGGHLILAQPDAWNVTIVDPERWLSADDAGWDRVLLHFGLRTLDRADPIPWEMARTDRVRYHYRLHGRLAVKEG